MPGLDWGNCVTNGVATLNCLPILLQNVISGLLYFSGAVALFLIIFAGIRFIMSAGDAKELDSARHALIFAMIGLGIVMLSFFLLNLISHVTGTPCITKIGFTNCQ